MTHQETQNMDERACPKCGVPYRFLTGAQLPDGSRINPDHCYTCAQAWNFISRGIGGNDPIALAKRSLAGEAAIYRSRAGWIPRDVLYLEGTQ